MRWAKLNTHTDASGNLCACNRIITMNGWHEIGGACYECRCWSRWSMIICWTQRWFLGLKNLLVEALHLVDGQSQSQELNRDAWRSLVPTSFMWQIDNGKMGWRYFRSEPWVSHLCSDIIFLQFHIRIFRIDLEESMAPHLNHLPCTLRKACSSILFIISNISYWSQHHDHQSNRML